EQAGAVGRVPAGDDPPDAAAGAFGDICGEPISVTGAVLQAGVHRTHHYPIAQDGGPKIQWGQQIRVPVCHAFSFKPATTSSSHSTALSSARMPPRSTRYWCNALPLSVFGSGNWR